MTLRRLLAVSHEATLTGAPMNLLHLLRWITTNTDIDVHTVVLADGPLRYQFAKLGDVTVLDGSPLRRLLGEVQHGLVALGSRRAWLPVASARTIPALRHLRGFDLAYLNSLTSVSVLPYLPSVRRVVSHVHELNVAIEAWRPQRDVELFRTRPDRWIAASDAVRRMLVDDLDLPDHRVLLHHEFIDATAFADAAVPLRIIERNRQEFRIPTEAAVVMGAGTVDWRKGPDLFVQLAAEVRRRAREEVHFVWVGGDLTGLDMRRLRSDMQRADVDHVHFVGVRPDPKPWFAMADVFALTSREDPFPLVCLEQAAMGHPIVTYRNGGIVELLEAAGPAAASCVVDHLDVTTMARLVVDLLADDERRRQVGRELKARVMAHHDVAVAAPRLVDELRELCESSQDHPGGARGSFLPS